MARSPACYGSCDTKKAGSWPLPRKAGERSRGKDVVGRPTPGWRGGVQADPRRQRTASGPAGIAPDGAPNRRGSPLGLFWGIGVWLRGGGVRSACSASPRVCVLSGWLTEADDCQPMRFAGPTRGTCLTEEKMAWNTAGDGFELAAETRQGHPALDPKCPDVPEAAEQENPRYTTGRGRRRRKWGRGSRPGGTEQVRGASSPSVPRGAGAEAIPGG